MKKEYVLKRVARNNLDIGYSKFEKKNIGYLEVKIPGYTLHGGYYLADEVITNVTWEEALKMKEVVTLPNGETVIARTFFKNELDTISEEERRSDCWYWTGTPYAGCFALNVSSNGGFYDNYIYYSSDDGGARLGFKNPFPEEKHSEGEIND